MDLPQTISRFFPTTNAVRYPIKQVPPREPCGHLVSRVQVYYALGHAGVVISGAHFYRNLLLALLNLE
jgi:hypothetical protein